MSSNLLECTISTRLTEDYSSMPPFFGKDKWIVDPTKIVTRQPKNSLQTTPETENEGDDKTIKNTPKTPTKHVQFASYADVYMRCPIIDAKVRYPSKMIEELKRENALLKDDLLISEKKAELLEDRLKRTQQELTRAHDNELLIIIMVSLMTMGLVMYYKYAQMGL